MYSATGAGAAGSGVTKRQAGASAGAMYSTTSAGTAIGADAAIAAGAAILEELVRCTPPLAQALRSTASTGGHFKMYTAAGAAWAGATIAAGTGAVYSTTGVALHAHGWSWRHVGYGLALAPRTRPPGLTSQPRLTLAQCTPPLMLARRTQLEPVPRMIRLTPA